MSEPLSAPVPELTPPWATDERLRIQAEARRFAMEEVLPLANELDPVKGEIPRWFLDRMGEQGYFGITVPTEFGGMGLGVFEYCMIAEELARAWMSVASIIARAQGMGTQFGDEAKRRRLLEMSARGQWIGAAALSEPDAGSDLANVSTRAVADGDEWVINGEKRWTGNAMAADFIQLLCRVADPGPGQPRSTGLATIIIEKERDALPPGITGRPLDKIGYHGFLTWNLTFENFRVPVANMVGWGRRPGAGSDRSGPSDGEGDGGRSAFRAVEAGLNVARVHTAARAVGLARAAVEDCIAYTQERVQFEHPISDFQAVRFKIAEMAARVEQARTFYRQVAHMIDCGLPCEREAAMVKLVATEMAVEVTGDGIQLHGGNGYTTEHQVERHWRDARLTTIFEGTSQIQQRIISDRLLPRSRLT
ncbi:MAG TPA: acyl-CoA dehydrogenase family protein [Acidimicrobiales bacterium]|nr:acyl-CoA dehydrogenase family protein [Acidimicrobiales bacterium]